MMCYKISEMPLKTIEIPAHLGRTEKNRRAGFVHLLKTWPCPGVIFPTTIAWKVSEVGCCSVWFTQLWEKKNICCMTQTHPASSQHLLFLPLRFCIQHPHSNSSISSLPFSTFISSWWAIQTANCSSPSFPSVIPFKVLPMFLLSWQSYIQWMHLFL